MYQSGKNNSVSDIYNLPKAPTSCTYMPVVIKKLKIHDKSIDLIKETA